MFCGRNHSSTTNSPSCDNKTNSGELLFRNERVLAVLSPPANEGMKPGRKTARYSSSMASPIALGLVCGDKWV